MNNLKKIRAIREATPKEISILAQVPERAYQMYEYDDREPRVRAAIRIARALGTTVEDLWGSKQSV